MALTMNLTNVQREQAEFKTASGEIVTLTDAKGEQYFREMEATIEPVQSGSGDPSPDNVRPISGFSEAKVTRTGKNLLDTTGTLAHNNYNFAGFPNTLKPNTTYVFSVNGTTSYRFALYLGTSGTAPNSTSTRLVGYLQSGASLSFTTPSEMSEEWLILAGSASGAGNEDFATIKPQIELGSTATDYEPYRGEEVTVQLGQTVYGGTLDVRRGKVRVTHKYWSSQGTAKTDWIANANQGYYTLKNYEYESLAGSHDGYCNMFVYRWSFNQTNGIMAYTNRVQVSKSPFSTLDEFFDAITATPIQLVYPLSTPFELTVTPEAIKTLTGENNVWADTGEITVTYKVDPDAEPTLTLAPLGENLGSLRPIATEAEEIIAESEDPENGANLSTESEVQNGETEME